MTCLVGFAPVTPPRTGRTFRAGYVIGAALRHFWWGCAGAGCTLDAAGVDGSLDVTGLIVFAPVACVRGCVAIIAGIMRGTSLPVR